MNQTSGIIAFKSMIIPNTTLRVSIKKSVTAKLGATFKRVISKLECFYLLAIHPTPNKSARTKIASSFLANSKSEDRFVIHFTNAWLSASIRLMRAATQTLLAGSATGFCLVWTFIVRHVTDRQSTGRHCPPGFTSCIHMRFEIELLTDSESNKNCAASPRHRPIPSRLRFPRSHHRTPPFRQQSTYNGLPPSAKYQQRFFVRLHVSGLLSESIVFDPVPWSQYAHGQTYLAQ